MKVIRSSSVTIQLDSPFRLHNFCFASFQKYMACLIIIKNFLEINSVERTLFVCLFFIQILKFKSVNGQFKQDFAFDGLFCLRRTLRKVS